MTTYDIKTLEQLEKLNDNRLLSYFKARRKILNGYYLYEQEDDLKLEMSRIKLVMTGRGHIKRD